MHQPPSLERRCTICAEGERPRARSDDSIIQIDVGSATTNEPKLTRLPTHLYSTPSAAGGISREIYDEARARAQLETCTPSFLSRTEMRDAARRPPALTFYRRKDSRRWRRREFCAIAAGRSPTLSHSAHANVLTRWVWQCGGVRAAINKESLSSLWYRPETAHLLWQMKCERMRWFLTIRLQACT